MIKRVRIRSGFAAELDCLKNRTFEFGPRVTVIYGPNGCGKTSLLKIMAGHTGITTAAGFLTKAGWSGPPPLVDREIKKGKFPMLFHKNTWGNCEALMTWDGMPCLYNSSSITDYATRPSHFMKPGKYVDGMTSPEDYLAMIANNPSHGQRRLHGISRVAKELKKIKNTIPYVSMRGCQYELCEAHYVEYIRKLTNNGQRRSRCTVLWDDPDRGLDLMSQFSLFGSALRTLSAENGFQFIVATQSPIPALFPNYDWLRIIEMQEGYLDQYHGVFRFIEKAKKNFEIKRKKQNRESPSSINVAELDYS